MAKSGKISYLVSKMKSSKRFKKIIAKEILILLSILSISSVIFLMYDIGPWYDSAARKYEEQLVKGENPVFTDWKEYREYEGYYENDVAPESIKGYQHFVEIDRLNKVYRKEKNREHLIMKYLTIIWLLIYLFRPTVYVLYLLIRWSFRTLKS